MKKYVFVLICMLILGIPFTTAVSAKELFQIKPIICNYSQTLNDDFKYKDTNFKDIVFKDTVFLAQAETTRKVKGQVDTDQVVSDPVVSGQGLPDQTQEDLDLDFFDDYVDKVEEEQMVTDPIYFFNYAMYSFNDVLYFYALKPIATAYKAVAPLPLRNGVNNFYHNLLFPVRFINNLLQGKLAAASDEIGIFLTNSFIGVLGFNQFAQKHLKMKTSDEDLGQTLGSYSIGNGFYLVLPILGPSSLRDALGRAGDSFITPVNYVEPWELSWGMISYDKINSTSFRIGDYEALKKASLDPYAAMKNAYIQQRRSLIKE
jgi:phospholipid-binding lipoprotein MlaA